MYLITKQTHAPTGFEHGIYCRFYNSKEKNLVVGVNNVLKVYRLIKLPSKESDSNEQDNVRLECLHVFTLHGAIKALQAVTLSNSRDSLLISFADAKVSLVEYDPTTHDMKTLSLHYFEDEDFKHGNTQIHQDQILCLDPEGRCAAYLAYASTIIILPFRKDTTIEEPDIKNALQSTNIAPLNTKSPIMATYTLDMCGEHYAGEKICNILDMQFLDGYYEPTLLILFEPLRTWSGRVAVRQDTVSMVALSLNVNQKVHPIIWSVSHLPYDCFKAMPVPKPIGGVLILAANSLTYLNQSVPAYSVSLNSFTRDSSNFPMSIQEGTVMTLANASACFISQDKLIVSSKNGELYVLTLINDGMRSIRKFHFDKAAKSVLASCLVRCDDGFLFVGSRLGNSVLLRYTEKQLSSFEKVNSDTGNETIVPPIDVLEEKPLKVEDSNSEEKQEVDDDEEEEPAAKKLKTESEHDEEQPDEQDDIDNWIAGDATLMSRDHLLQSFDERNVTEDAGLTTLVFELCDDLINIGPCGKACMGEPAFLSEEFAGAHDPQVDVITSSGHGQDGAISILHRTVRPNIVTTFDMPDCRDMWTVYGSAEDLAPESPGNTFVNGLQTHAFLVMSRDDSTLILQTDQGIVELEQSGFSTQSPTLYAGNVGNNRYILQICTTTVRLLDGIQQLQNIPLNIGSPVVSAAVSDPFAIVMAENGALKQLKFSNENGPRIVVSDTKLNLKKSKISAFTLYKDTSGLFTVNIKDDYVPNEVQTIAETEVRHDTSTIEAHLLPTASASVDDEDELLYGSSTVEIGASLLNIKTEESQNETNSIKIDHLHKVSQTEPTYWLFVANDAGVLKIYSIPDYEPVYYVKNFPLGPKVVVDSFQSTDASVQQEPASSMPSILEICVSGLGALNSRPVMFVRTEDEVMIYEVYPYYDTGVEKNLKVRFRKLNEVVILQRHEDEKRDSEEQSSDIHVLSKWFRPFHNISSYAGVFMCGPHPTWFFMGTQGELRRHEMSIDGSITCFAPFHNVNCSQGFLYFNRLYDLRIATLPTQLYYDAPWAVRKVPVHKTVHFINYHVESKCYCIVTSIPETVTKLVRIAGDEKDYEVLERDSRYIWPTSDKFCLQLFSPVSWEFIKGTEIDLEEWERVTCIKNVSLASEGTESGMKGYVALGTNYCYGEDVTNRGRILIIDIIEVVPEPGQPLTKNKIKVMYSKEQKGPVTALCQVKGFLLSAIGQKVYIWQLKESLLVGVAFIDTQIYIHTAVSIKNLILVADVYKSVSLLRYQDETRTLALVSRDTKSFEVYSCDFVVDENQLCFIVSDADQNIIVYSYSPELRESFGGTRLIRRADYQLGTHVNCFFRIRAKALTPEMKALSRKQLTVYSSLDGGFGYFLPVSEKTYKRLFWLQNVMAVSIPHTAGLNPKAYRLVKAARRGLSNPSKNILDGDFLWRFLTLSLNERVEMTRKIGTTPSQIIEDLHEIERMTAHF
ncbi:Cleavage and polyadenylation specificity factor subunit 1 [Halotydeus destructor]|nr:Cleavage and polyadenylation specificity factor subunit 1 [Halotydeus destructor]